MKHEPAAAPNGQRRAQRRSELDDRQVASLDLHRDQVGIELRLILCQEALDPRLLLAKGLDHLRPREILDQRGSGRADALADLQIGAA